MEEKRDKPGSKPAEGVSREGELHTVLRGTKEITHACSDCSVYTISKRVSLESFPLIVVDGSWVTTKELIIQWQRTAIENKPHMTPDKFEPIIKRALAAIEKKA